MPGLLDRKISISSKKHWNFSMSGMLTSDFIECKCTSLYNDYGVR